MLNKDEELKNCPICGSDRVGIIATTDYQNRTYSRTQANIKCFNCETLFLMYGKTLQNIIDLWNNGNFQKSSKK